MPKYQSTIYRFFGKQTTSWLITLAWFTTFLNHDLFRLLETGNWHTWEYLELVARISVSLVMLGYIYVFTRKESNKDYDKVFLKIDHYQSLLIENKRNFPVTIIYERSSQDSNDYNRITIDPYYYDRRDLRRTREAFFEPGKIPPPASLEMFPPEDLRDFEAFVRRNNDVQAVSNFYWTKRMMIALRSQPGPFLSGTVKNISFGFQEFDREGYRDRREFILGTILHFDPTDFRQLSWLKPRGTRKVIDYGEAQLIGSMSLGEFDFPIFGVASVFVPQCHDSHPVGGTMTSLAESTYSVAELGPGFLTARHVTGALINKKIKLECGHWGVVADVGKDGIDAAFVICPKCKLTKGAPVNIKRQVAVWSDVVIQTRAQPITTRVVQTTDTIGVYNQYQIPVQFFFADAGLPGDSGSMVIDAETGDAIAIYLGEIMDGAFRHGGYSLSIYQATQLLKLNLFN